MRRLMIISSVLILFLALGGAAGAALVNGGFETGDLTGWTSTGNVSVVTGANPDGVPYGPVEGTYFSLAVAGNAGFFYNVSQSVAMAAGDTLSGYALFDGQDTAYYNDYAAVRILDSASVQVAQPWYRDCSQVGSGHTNWESWSWTAPSAGTYFLQLGTANIGDYFVPSYGYFDANQHTVVPLPGAVWLLGSGLVGLLGYRRMKG